MSFYNQLTKFVNQATTNDLRTSEYSQKYSDLNIKVSFGMGTPAKIPWISFLGIDQTTSRGIYPVYLYFKDLDKLILAYGISETEEAISNWRLNNSETITSYFAKEGRVPYRYGDSYVYKVYDPSNLKQQIIDDDLNSLLKYYKSLFIKPDNLELNSIHISIKTKPFIILAGISGTGKSRLVRKLAYEFCNSEELKRVDKPGNFELVKVKPNWHDSTELLGYESRISGKDRYIVTDFLKFLIKAWQYPDTPFYLCLDEMNLAPVEQYFAEYLSVIETRDLKEGKIKTDSIVNKSLFERYADKTTETDPDFDLWKELNINDEELKKKLLEYGLTLPPNLIVMGTVNMDETTHSFSRKVLDRAMTIEMTVDDLYSGLTDDRDYWDYPDTPFNKKLVISEKTDGWQVYNEFVSDANLIIKYLELLNNKLEGTPFKIAYRVRDEFLLYAYNVMQNESKTENWLNEVKDEMTLMKILPRIEGDEEKTAVLMDLIEIFKNEGLENSLKKAIKMNKKRTSFHYTSYWD